MARCEQLRGAGAHTARGGGAGARGWGGPSTCRRGAQVGIAGGVPGWISKGQKPNLYRTKETRLKMLRSNFVTLCHFLKLGGWGARLGFENIILGSGEGVSQDGWKKENGKDQQGTQQA